MCGTVDLVIVVVQTGDVCAGELGHLASWSTNTAADIQHLHALLDTNVVSQVVLVASNGLVERLAIGETAEVEALAPAVLIEIGSKVVVVSGQGGVFSSSGLERIFMLVKVFQ